jgi:hypothetical protein
MNKLEKVRKSLSSGSRSWIPTAWVIFLMIVSMQPLRSGLARAGSVTHVILHVLVFGFTACLLHMWGARPASPWVAALGTFWLAVGIELAQHLVYRHTFEWQDLFADVLGTVIAILLLISKTFQTSQRR